jgi:N-methylhydantoinase A/oxoprolinase/acetone carboxylase beta subunit
MTRWRLGIDVGGTFTDVVAEEIAGGARPTRSSRRSRRR